MRNMLNLIPKIFFIFIILLSSFSFAQNKNVKISDLQPKSESSVFPLISIPADKKVEEKINTFLQVTELENIPDTRKNPFQLAQTASNSYTNYVSFYEWKKLETPKNILSLFFSGEATGAYSEMFDKWNSFDLRDGNYINIKDLLTDDGIALVETKVNSAMKKEISDFIAELKTENPTEKDEKERLEEQLFLYEDCLNWVNTQNLSWFEYYFEKDHITFVRGRCSNHAMRALDDLYDYQIPVSYREIAPYLSDYGKSLIFNSPQNIGTENPSNKLYKGRIDGKYEVYFLINEINEDDSLSVTYWYGKYKKLINLRGEFVHNRFSLIEDDYHDENQQKWIPKAFIEIDLKGKKLIGTWQDFKTKKYLKLELEEL